MPDVTERLREGAHAIAEKASEWQERIGNRAHAIWEREGRPHGRDRDHWHTAETELSAEAAAAPAEVRAPEPGPKPRAAKPVAAPSAEAAPKKPRRSSANRKQ